MRRTIGLFVLSFAAAASAAETNTFYTVTVDGGTCDAPASLDDQAVLVESAGAAAETVPFSEARARFASGPAIFRKRGAGWMMSSIGMADFTGEIRVEEGAFMVNTNLMAGPLDVAKAPTVVVSNGASFALAAVKATCETGKLRLNNAFRLAGDGVDGLGAVANLLGSNQMSLFGGAWTFDGDATLSGRSECRYDMLGEQRVFDLNGHTLTLRKGKSGKSWSFCIANVKVGEGDIVVDGATLLVQAGRVRWGGDERNTLTITNGATLSFYNNTVEIPWTVKFYEGSYFSSGGSNKEAFRSDGTNGYNRLAGPVAVYGLTTFRGAYQYAGLTVPKLLAEGPGPLKVRAAWLNLLDPGSYRGRICVDDQPWDGAAANNRHPSGLALYSPEAYGADAAGVALTNASLRLMLDEKYCLPPVAFSVPSGTNSAISGGAAGSVCASLEKFGGGTLDFDTPLSVTGRLELAEGTLRFRATPEYLSANGGLWKCIVPQGDTELNHDFMNQTNTSFHSNEVVTCCDMLKTPTYPPWQKFASVAWGGYVWNRSPTNETWRFAAAISGYSKLWIDDVYRVGTDDNAGVSFCNVEMTPGPHKFLFKVNPRGYAHPGSAGSVRNRDWADETLGLMVSRTSLTSTNSADFAFLENAAAAGDAGGDGSVFTRDARDVGDFDASELLALQARFRPVPNLACRPGTAVDLGDGNTAPLVVDDFEGVTSVVNGGLNVAKRWRLSPEHVQGGGALACEGRLSFSAGCALEWDDLSLLPRRGVYTIATAAGGIEGMPEWRPAAGDSRRCWRLARAQDASGRDTLTFRWSAGTVVTVR